MVDTPDSKSGAERRAGSSPARGTKRYTGHNACLSNVFKTAVRYGWINEWQVPKLVNDGEPGMRRPHFDEDEIAPLLVKMWDLIPEGRKQKTREIRQLLSTTSASCC